MNVFRFGAAVSLVAYVALSGCAGVETTVQKVTVQSFEVNAAKAKKDVAFAEITNVLVDKGFDIKQSNKEAGLITTEFKKFNARGENPPFDYYLQLRINLRDSGGTTAIKFTPVAREQNRRNSAAMTEHELYYFEGRPNFVSSMEKGSWATPGNQLFTNVVNEVSEKVGSSASDIKKNTTSTTVSALL